MNGHILQGTTICVDYWLQTPPKKYIHFLTHLHADHTVGLKSTFRDTIYTSSFNAWLLKRWFKIDPNLIVSLSLEDSHLIYNESSEEMFTVTLIDANHCPGSVMFLFQGRFGNVLYTGDFRYNVNMLKDPTLQNVVKNEILHKLYLDNTFAAEHCKFPPRHKVLLDVIELVRNNPDFFILIGVRKLGKEEVLQEIAISLQEKVYVSLERLKILTFLQFRNVFTTNSEESRIHAKEIHLINSNYIRKLQEERGPILIIMLTALHSVTPPADKHRTKLEEMFNVHYMPYSDHSSHDELKEFVSYLKPHSIHPIVQVNPLTSKKSTVACELELSETWRNTLIPQSILAYCKNPLSVYDTISKVEDFGIKRLKKTANLINQITNNSDYKIDEEVLSQFTEDESSIDCNNTIFVSDKDLTSQNHVESTSELSGNESEISLKQNNYSCNRSNNKCKSTDTDNGLNDMTFTIPQRCKNRKFVIENNFDKKDSNKIEQLVFPPFSFSNENGPETKQVENEEDEFSTMSDEDLDLHQYNSFYRNIVEKSAHSKQTSLMDTNKNKSNLFESEMLSSGTIKNSNILSSTPFHVETLSTFESNSTPMSSKVNKMHKAVFSPNRSIQFFSLRPSIRENIHDIVSDVPIKNQHQQGCKQIPFTNNKNRVVFTCTLNGNKDTRQRHRKDKNYTYCETQNPFYFPFRIFKPTTDFYRNLDVYYKSWQKNLKPS